MHRLGLDLGSSYTKGVLVDGAGAVVDRLAVKTGYDFLGASRQVIETLSRGREISTPVFSCGYGREQVDRPHAACSEIIALARAVFERYRRAGVILDIGGQDTKYIKITDEGIIGTFKLNRKCAAGTGSFLEEIAFRLGVPPEDFNRLAGEATDEIRISSFCTVFAISEVIGLIKKGVSLPNIVLGIYHSIVGRALELAPPGEHLILTGGVPAMHPAIVALFRKAHPDAEGPEDAQFLTAYGSVLVGSRKRGDAR